jgi:hypothetical protein
MDTWNARAKCFHDPRIDTDFFFPEWEGNGRSMLPTPQTTHMIARYCSDCPVRRECERQAALAGETHGFWGGKAASQCKP